MKISSSLRRIYSGGLVCAVLAAVAGIALERARFGSTEAQALSRVESSVRSDMASVFAALNDIAVSVSREPGLFDASAADPTGGGARALFDRADTALEGRTPEVFAVTAYRASGSGIPLAWSGRPSEISPDRLAESENFFVDSGPLGLRLVYVKPVIDQSTGHRLGMVAAERVLSASRGVRAVPAEVVLAISSPVSVTVKPHTAPQIPAGNSFLIASPNGEPLLDARVTPEALGAARREWRGDAAALVLAILALTLVISIPPLLRWRKTLKSPSDQISVLGIVFALLLAARAVLWLAPAGNFTTQIFHTEALGAPLRALLRSPVDFLLSMMLLGALVLLGFEAADRLRRAVRHRRPPPALRHEWGLFAVTQVMAGAVVALLVVGFEVILGNAISATSVDALHFSLHPWDAFATARMAFAIAVILGQGVVLWLGVLLFQFVSAPWRTPRAGTEAAVAFGLRMLPIGLIAAFPRVIGAAPSTVPQWPMVFAGLACVVLAWGIGWVRPLYRHASQALRLFAGLLVLLIPAFVLYPSVLHFADRGLRRLIEEQYAVQALNQRAELQQKLQSILQQIDRARVPGLGEPSSSSPAPTSNEAFALWSETDLATERLAASIELYAPSDGRLVSRFALNLPEYVSSAQRWREPSCQWEIFEEASPFGSEERRLLHAGRGICLGNSDTPAGGSIVVNVMLDYETLPFITVRNPYYELVRTPDSAPAEGATGRDVEFVVYGWGRGSLYASGGTAWPLDERLLERIASSRASFWTMMSSGERDYYAYIQNDRVGIYVIGYPAISATDHLINLAELATLVGVTYIAFLIAALIVTALAGASASSGRDLLREVRASFYRKLFIAFLAAAVVPVLVLALATRQFFAVQLRAGIESDAVRVAAVAQRVVEEYVALQQREAGAAPNDDIMVWLSRAIGQDVNIFHDAVLLATSERDLFASGLLPFRTPSEVYRAIVIDRLSSNVSQETAGDTRYTLAAAPVRVGESRAILTVPLALREQEIDREIDALDRRVLLASLLFALLGAGIGYYMAERIGDPVNRLTRATRRIARGDFSARIVQTSTDELRRLVDDFNRMAADLQRQRAELERTHRLEAWAEMARQVAHEIKNPLTPIQLSSEHLVRVNKDRGEPLTPVLEECVTAIMSQVKLLRQISSEFSSFASSPTPHPSATSLSELISAVLEPYITGLNGRIAIRTDVPASLPHVLVDRTLLARALTNIIENALHAMPGSGSLTVAGELTGPTLKLSFADTGTGMDPEALRRIFEPYFSTKATGTGLGLTIAKRNVELNGGAIRVHSVQGHGTTVTIELPALK